MTANVATPKLLIHPRSCLRFIIIYHWFNVRTVVVFDNAISFEWKFDHFISIGSHLIINRCIHTYRNKLEMLFFIRDNNNIKKIGDIFRAQQNNANFQSKHNKILSLFCALWTFILLSNFVLNILQYLKNTRWL